MEDGGPEVFDRLSAHRDRDHFCRIFGLIDSTSQLFDSSALQMFHLFYLLSFNSFTVTDIMLYIFFISPWVLNNALQSLYMLADTFRGPCVSRERSAGDSLIPLVKRAGMNGKKPLRSIEYHVALANRSPHTE